MDISNQEAVKQFAEIGNDLQGHRVSGKNKSEVKAKISKVLKNARKRCK